jgi:hypothetical protein
MDHNLIDHVDLGRFVDWVWELKRERDELLSIQKQQQELAAKCSCPMGDNSLNSPCAVHPPKQVIQQWSDDGLVWLDGSEGEMVSARCAGYQTRRLYLHNQ